MHTDISVKLDTSMSRAIKGFALILMIIHHCFGFPSWHINGISYGNASFLGLPFWSWIMNTTGVCVSLFAFLTGWAYFFNKKPSLKYGVKKIIHFLKYYWFILFIIFIPIAMAMGTYVPTFSNILLNMFALKNSLVSLAWYVYFYIFVMLTLPIIIKLINFKWWVGTAFVLACFILSYYVLAYVTISRGYLKNDFYQCVYWYPCVLSGYLVARFDLYNRLHQYLKQQNKILFIIVIAAVLVCRVLWQQVFLFNLDALYAPIIIFALMMLLQQRPIVIIRLLEFLGRHALNIWFLHSIFFTSYLVNIFQPIAYLPKNPVLVVIWVILLCLPFSIAINYIFKQQEKLFSSIKRKPHPQT